MASHLEPLAGTATASLHLKHLINVYLLSTNNFACTSTEKSSIVAVKKGDGMYHMGLQPDWLEFPENRSRWLTEGTVISVKPVYCSQVVFLLEMYDSQKTFQICGSAVSWLKWDSTKGTFVGQVPQCSDIEPRDHHPTRHQNKTGSQNGREDKVGKVLCIEIRATLTIPGPSELWYERTIRARLNFRVVPEPVGRTPEAQMPLCLRPKPWERNARSRIDMPINCA